MKPEQLLEYLGNLADAHKATEEVLQVPTVPRQPGWSYHNGFLVAVSAQDVRDFVEWVKPWKYADRRDQYRARDRMETEEKNIT